MDAGCSALVGKLEDMKLALKNPSRDDDANSDSDDGCDGEELLAAAEEGRGADAVLSILQKNPSLIRTVDFVRNTVLHMAARDGDIETVCKLIAFLEERQDEDLMMVFMDVNVDGDTALHLALKNRHREVACHLIKAAWWTRYISNDDGIYPTELAKEAGFREVCELTADKCLHFVSALADVEMGAVNQEIDISDGCDSSDGCDRAERLGAIKEIDISEVHLPMVGSALVDVEMRKVKRDLMAKSRSVPDRWNELDRAIQKGDEDVLITGLRRDAEELLWHQGASGERLLHTAVGAGGMGLFRKLVQFMISNGLTDAALLGDGNGNTALHRATENEEFNKAICLIKAEPRAVYQVNHCGESPLYLAVKLRREDLVEHMVTQSCLPPWESEMLRHPKHATLAHLAIMAKSFGTLKLLLKHLPELVKGKDEKGWRPLSYAANKGRYLDEVTYILTNFPKSAEKRDNDGSFPIHKAVAGGHVSIIKAFYELCPQTLQQIDKKGRTVLHIAASYGRSDIFTYLTKELKLDDSFLNLKDNEGKTFKDYA